MLPRSTVSMTRRSASGLAPFDPKVLDPSNEQQILVTGATGFLGSSVLEAVLNAFPKAHVTALLRGTPEGGLDRIRAVAERRQLATLAHLDRLSVVIGDVSKPQLGLSEGDWRRFSVETDLIVHASGKATT